MDRRRHGQPSWSQSGPHNSNGYEDYAPAGAYQSAYSGWDTHTYPYGHGETPGAPHWDTQYAQRAPWPSEMQSYGGDQMSGQPPGAYHQQYYHPSTDFDDQAYPPTEPPSSSPPYDHGAPTSTGPGPSNTRPAKSPTPPPPPRSPSPTYLAQSEQPSSKLARPEDLRKLLILDLNGSLLIRAAHRPASERKRGHDRTQTGGDAPNGGPQQFSRRDPKLRAVHPRPYMPAFRAYLFAPETRRWLDVMVWSSAQPHSVADMVGHCFGEEKKHLVAVWARDTLGLSKADYHRKTQTTKDLAKPWAELPLQPRISRSPSRTPADTGPSSRSRSSSPPNAHRLPGHSPLATTDERGSAHSAASTLLLDDSPAKARLQPWNHVCLKEYDSKLRSQDLKLLELERARTREAEVMSSPGSDAAGTSHGASDRPLSKKNEEIMFSSGVHEDLTDVSNKNDASLAPAGLNTTSGPQDASADATDPSGSPESLTKKRKRQRKKKKDSSTTALQNPGDDEDRFDETLLAVIGVLDALRTESSVAGWIRSGGLWGPDQPPSPSTGQDVAGAELEDGKTWEEWNGIQPEEPASGANVENRAPDAAAESDSDLSVDGQTDGKLRPPGSKKRMRPSPPSPLATTAPTLIEKGTKKVDEEKEESPIPGLTGGVVLGPGPETRTDQAESSGLEAKEGEDAKVPEMWFERPATVRYWAQRGRRACEDLGILVVHGIDR